MVLKMLFFFLNNTNFQFNIKDFIWKLYSTVEALSTINWIKFINKKVFAKAIIDKNLKTFVIYILSLEIIERLVIYLSRATQMTTLYWNKIFTKIPTKYFKLRKYFFTRPSQGASGKYKYNWLYY